MKANIYCWDDNKKTRAKTKKLKLPINKFWLNKNELDNIVVSPGIDIKKCKIKNYLEKNSNKIITDLDLFFEMNKNALIISVTGTNGKSTTCKIIEKVFPNVFDFLLRSITKSKIFPLTTVTSFDC